MKYFGLLAQGAVVLVSTLFTGCGVGGDFDDISTSLATPYTVYSYGDATGSQAPTGAAPVGDTYESSTIDSDAPWPVENPFGEEQEKKETEQTGTTSE